jgi:redox-sensitive bicupin YhaK (pirin superfamily)
VKKVIGIHSQPLRHWVGDGFPVRSLFSYSEYGKLLSPFLLLDHAGPASFTPTDARRGVGEHPHRGFETVTIVYQGELEHRDSSGGGGLIGPGDVQWMTAGAGILHEEFHSPRFAQNGGTLEMAQLWVNLPAGRKMTPPRYQTILDRTIPVVDLPEGAGTLRVIAGEYAGTRGPASTHSPMGVWDLRLEEGRRSVIGVPEGWTVLAVVLRGTVEIGDDAQVANQSQWAVLDRSGTEVVLSARTDATVLLLTGEPLGDPIVGYGPFVMNSKQQIVEAIEDFNSGRFGQLVASDAVAAR